MRSVKTGSALKWTEKVPLSSRIIDPLGIYVLKHLESYFLPGITTQTARLRYFSLLTWAWKTVEDLNLDPKKVLDIEKIVTLAAALHHLNLSDAPVGIRNLDSATSFLRSNDTIRIDKYTNFGRKNRIGYGNYYYRGPLASLNICAKNASGKTIFSEVGRRIADIFGKIGKNSEEQLLKEEISKKELEGLTPFCFCSKQILPEEKEIWRLVFFGFTKPATGLALSLDFDTFAKFERRELTFPEISADTEIDLEGYLRDIDKLESVFAKNLPEMIKTTIARRAVLLMIMKIIHEASPRIDGEPLNQIIRDCLYYKQFTKDNSIRKIDFGKLREFSELWEAFVHNLYYINFLEFAFDILLSSLMLSPNGTTIDEIVASFDIKEVMATLRKKGIAMHDDVSDIQQIDSYIKHMLSGNKTSLTTFPNEKQVALDLRRPISREEKLVDLIILFLLLKYRFNSFSEKQLKVCDFRDKPLCSILPKTVYATLGRESIPNFFREILSLVKNRHKLISSMKFALNGTRSWLLTEEDDRLYYYGRKYRLGFYREAKWHNIVELLTDMGLITIEEKRYRLTELGEEWLAKIF
ncbi:MAG: hypothetical protein DSO00_04895 [Archaeoglobi archaeon]|jgi:hypothetical protein|nr:MAG: hypothetical protein DSO00_04895 [Archaeoglobi archaeon]